MHALISYTQTNSEILEKIGFHLKVLQQEGVLSAWEAHEIIPGSESDQKVYKIFTRADLWIPLISRHSLALLDLYRERFQKAYQMEEDGELIIFPVIIESGEWLNSPFNHFGFLLRNNKPFIQWDNKNKAMNKIIQNIRILVAEQKTSKIISHYKSSGAPRKDHCDVEDLYPFDYDEIKFMKESFHHIKVQINRYMQKTIYTLDLKSITYIDTGFKFESVITNKHNAAKSLIRLRILSEKLPFYSKCSPINQLRYYFEDRMWPVDNIFILSADDHKLSWILHKNFSGLENGHNYNPNEIAKIIWDDWLKKCSIL